jgi:acyl-CoA synthetase (AMP-forming)/AMP-acid ligase II/aminoglycoside N3'-acetyltransferase
MSKQAVPSSPKMRGVRRFLRRCGAASITPKTARSIGVLVSDFQDQTLAAVLDERARIDGDQPFALFSHAPPVSAIQHLENATRSAAALAAYGATRGSRVVLLGATGPEFLAALAGCWRVGALTCPAEAFLSAEGMRKIVQQFHPNLAVVDSTLKAGAVLAEICEGVKVPVLELANVFTYDGRLTSPAAVTDDPAVCIFTSGSTGVPKGVVLSHRNLLAGAANLVAAKRIGRGDRVLCVLPMSHLNGLETTFVTPLVSGGSAVYLQGPFQPESALKLIDEHRCTWFSAVPTQYAYLLKPPVPRGKWTLRTLRFCRSASAPLPIRVRREFESHYGVPIVETMGMTETSGQIFCNPMPPEQPREGSVGRPVGFDVRIVDENGRRCGADEVGEIQVHGPAIMLGYLDNPEETSRAFDDDWLRSGDLGSFDVDGFYYIRGRIKDIAIFSGVNISLRAIEAAVQEAGLVDDIACVGVSDYFFGETVVAYAIVRAADGGVSAVAARIAEKLRAFLPSQQALKEVRIVSRFPRNSAGKVLKGRLGEAEIVHTTHSVLSRDPRKMVGDILHIPEAEIRDEVGLGLIRQWDSLGHVALMLAVETLLERHLSPDETVGITTFRGLAAVLDGSFDLGLIDMHDGVLVGGPEQSHRATELTRERQDLISMMRYNRLLPDDEGEAARPVAPAPLKRRFISAADLTAVLHEAGLESEDTVLLHSDIGRVGVTEAGYDREGTLDFYLSGFLNVLGPKGTLCVCTSFEDFGRYGTPFIRENSPSRLGAFSEYVRTRPGAVRSMHPILSITSLGASAEEISGGSHFDGFGYDSPWGRLHRLNAKQMTLGMSGYPTIGLTFVHYIEHLYGVPYQYTKIYQAPVFAAGDRVPGPFTMSVRYLDFGITYDSTRLRDLMLQTGDAKRVPLGDDAVFCTTSEKMTARAVECLSRDRWFFLKTPPNFRAGVVPMDGTTGEMKDVYDNVTQA